MTTRIRTGIAGKKLGMTNFFIETGEALPVTLIQLLDNYVYDCKKLSNCDFSKIAIAFEELSSNEAKKSSLKLKTDEGEKFFRRLKEFRVSSRDLPVKGKKLAVTHFQDGQVVDVTGTSIGKGFAGPMKRHNFSGLRASHGVSVSHRSHGSTGQCQDPGRVFKGKKMAGHMGNKTITIQNLTVVKVDEELGIIAVLGAVPGSKNSVVYVNDAIKSFVSDDAPFPASYIGDAKGSDINDLSAAEAPSSDETKESSEV